MEHVLAWSGVMQRETKFRGKSLADLYDYCKGEYVFKKGEWVYGNLVVSGKERYIVGEVIDAEEEYITLEWWVEVDPATVGQFTGLLDKNYTKIFEGDILEKIPRAVYYGYDDDVDENEPPERDVATMSRFPRYWMERETFGYEGEDLEDPERWVVIGNKWDNPELLEVKL